MASQKISVFVGCKIKLQTEVGVTIVASFLTVQPFGKYIEVIAFNILITVQIFIPL